MTTAPRDAGMSLIELVLGLAIASGLALALAGLLTFSVQARARMDEATKVEAALIELKVASEMFSQLTPLDAALRVEDDQQGVKLVFTPAGEATQPLTFELSTGDPGLRIADAAGRIVGPVQLGAFEQNQIEFLAWRGDRLAWLPEGEAGVSALMGVRLMLTRANRHWPVMLWMARTPVRK